MAANGYPKKQDQSKVSFRLRNSDYNDIQVGNKYTWASKETADPPQAAHQKVGPKSPWQSDALNQDILETNDYPEPELMREHTDFIAKHPWSPMPSSTDAGKFVHALVKRIDAKNTMEIGVYTGYSLLGTALALPNDGKILAIDIKMENYSISLPVFQKAGVTHKIWFIEGPALGILNQLVQDASKHGKFDFIFVDADMDNNLKYHERLMKLVKVGGLIGYNQTLGIGSMVTLPDVPLHESVQLYRNSALELKKALTVDSRINIRTLPIGDGITLCHRLK